MAEAFTPDPQAACFGKTRYSTEQVARDAAVGVMNARGVSLRVYPCGAGCGGFHLTKSRAEPAWKPGWRPAKQSARRDAFEQRRDRGRRRR
jgi:hypothetical protein